MARLRQSPTVAPVVRFPCSGGVQRLLGTWRGLRFPGVAWRRLSTVGFVVLALALTSCRQSVDLASLAALSKTVADTQASFATLSDDLRGSCLRTIGWLRVSGRPGRQLPDAFSSCQEVAKASQQWQSANSVVTSYVAALGALAGGNDTAGDFGLSQFAQSFGSLGVTSCFAASRQQAVSGAAASLVGDYFKAKRRDALAPIITGADTDLGTIVATLEDVASTNYVTQLTTERIAMQGFFDPGIAQAQAQHETMHVFEMRNAELVEQQRIDARQGAVTSYIAALENIRATHKQIAQAIASDKLSDVASIVSGYVANYQPQLTALQKAFH